MADDAYGATVAKRRLSRRLAELRTESGHTANHVCDILNWGRGKVGRFEANQWKRPEMSDIRDLLRIYGVDSAAAEELEDLAIRARARPWWRDYTDIFENEFPGFENDAERIQVCMPLVVPGLLQTQDYARAVIQQGSPGLDADEVERRVQLRMGRQELLKRENPPRFWAIVDEAALRRPMGGRDVHVAQIERLMDVIAEPNITLQVMPFKYGGHAADGGAFMIMRFPDTDLPDIVYMEYLTGAHYIDKDEEVERYAAVMERLSVAGTSPDRTREILAGMLKEI